jgi:biotin-(acetyl-CoA carboxylase) ligase
VVGIGVNVNNRVQGAGFGVQEGETPEFQVSGSKFQVERAAVSLFEYDGVQRPLTDVLIAVLDELDRRWRELLSGDSYQTAAAHRARCLLTNKIVRIEQPGGSIVAGVCRGIDDLGRLRVQTERGETAVVSGTVLAWEPRN